MDKKKHLMLYDLKYILFVQAIPLHKMIPSTLEFQREFH